MNEDEVEETTCSPCSREGRKVEATKFCEECNEHLCEKCVHDHKKFVVTQTHRIVGKTIYSLINETKVKYMPVVFLRACLSL